MRALSILLLVGIPIILAMLILYKLDRALSTLPKEDVIRLQEWMHHPTNIP